MNAKDSDSVKGYEMNLKRKGKRGVKGVLNKEGDNIEHDELGWSLH